jgi:hypothetical protein
MKYLKTPKSLTQLDALLKKLNRKLIAHFNQKKFKVHLSIEIQEITKHIKISEAM